MIEVKGHTRTTVALLVGAFFIGIWIIAWVRPDVLPVYASIQRTRLVVSLVVGFALIIEAINLFSQERKNDKE